MTRNLHKFTAKRCVENCKNFHGKAVEQKEKISQSPLADNEICSPIPSK
jgi:hypothetical protein